jgi:hypothetical protein
MRRNDEKVCSHAFKLQSHKCQLARRQRATRIASHHSVIPHAMQTSQREQELFDPIQETSQRSAVYKSYYALALKTTLPP